MSKSEEQKRVDAEAEAERAQHEARYRSTARDLEAQQASGNWPPQITELQLQAAAVEGRLTNEAAEVLAENLSEEGVDVEPEDLQSGDASPVAPASAEEDPSGTSNKAREEFQGAVDKAAGDDTKAKETLEEDKAKSGTKAQAEARKSQGAK